MITSKKELKEYLAMDRFALNGENSSRHPSFFGDEIWKFEIILRKHEYCENVHAFFLKRLFYKYLHHNLGIKLGFLIPVNTFGPGLKINHTGCIVVNPEARIGAFCDIHQCVVIGESTDKKAPVIGDDVWIGPGAKLFGGINVADGTMIGANSVISKSITEPGMIVHGAPAKVISTRGNVYRKLQAWNDLSR